MSELVRYDALCRAMAEAKTVDEVKNVHDVAVAMAAYARQAKNRSLEADAVVVRMRATRELDRLRNRRRRPSDSRPVASTVVAGPKMGWRNTPAILRPTLAMQGITRTSPSRRGRSARCRTEFEAVVADAHDKVARAVRNAVRESR